MTQSLTDVLLEQTADIKAGIADLKNVNHLLTKALVLARGELVEESGYTSRHPTIQAIDEVLAYAKPEGLAKLNASEMAGEPVS